jgi:hypothetical protein
VSARSCPHACPNAAVTPQRSGGEEEATRPKPGNANVCSRSPAAPACTTHACRSIIAPHSCARYTLPPVHRPHPPALAEPFKPAPRPPNKPTAVRTSRATHPICPARARKCAATPPRRRDEHCSSSPCRCPVPSATHSRPKPLAYSRRLCSAAINLVAPQRTASRLAPVSCARERRAWRG